MSRIKTPKDSTKREHTARVDGVIFENRDSEFVILKLADGFSAVGNGSSDDFPRDSNIRFLGRWEEGKYGPQFKFSSWIQSTPGTHRGVITYLRKNCEGIGQAIADKLFAEYGPDAIQAIRERPTEIANKGFITLEKAILASRALEAIRATEETKVELFGLLDGYGIHGKSVDLAIQKWVAKAGQVVRKNPFKLLGFPGAGFKRLDKIWLDLKKPKDSFIRQGLFVDNWIYTQGEHTWFSEFAATEALTSQIPNARPERAVTFARRAGLIRVRADEKGRKWVAKTDAARDEATIAMRVDQLSKGPSLWPQLVFTGKDGDPSEHQVEQANKTTATSFGLLTGGPGTGKTFTLAAILKPLIAKYGESEIAVCAPTGKAAVRATESLKRLGIKIQATTIHSLLRLLSTRGDSYRFIVGDEMSMASTELAAALLRAIDPPTVVKATEEIRIPPRGTIPAQCRRCGRPLKDPESIEIGMGPECRKYAWESNGVHRRYVPDYDHRTRETIIPAFPEVVVPGTQVIWIGDPDQLPPVGHGAPLRDLIQSGRCGHGKLMEVRRNAGDIVHACAAIRDKKPVESRLSNKYQPDEGKNLVFVESDSEDRSLDTLYTLVQKMRNFHPVRETQVLVAMNKSSRLSRAPINDALQNLLNPSGANADNNPFRVGDKVICLKNGKCRVVEPIAELASTDAREYQSKRDEDSWDSEPEEMYVANGETGFVAAVASSLMVVQIGESLVAVPIGKRKDDGEEDGRGCSWDLGYAISTHKSQGSESPCIIVLGDPSATRVAGCEWWYTAISRASKCCIVIGRREVFENQRARTTTVRRKTFLVELLKETANQQKEEGKEDVTESHA